MELGEKERYIESKNILINEVQMSLERNRRIISDLEKTFATFLGDRIVAYSRSIPSDNIIISRLESASSDRELYLYLQCYIAALKKNTSSREYFRIVIIIADELKRNNLSARLITNNDGAVFYPSGAEELDETLVEDILKWLSDIPTAQQAFIAALKMYSTSSISKCLDELRKSFEFTLRAIFKNKKSLENQSNEIRNLFSEKGVDPQIRNIFTKIYNFYIIYQNENVKHGEGAKYYDIEFILYQTGSMIRFLLRLTME